MIVRKNVLKIPPYDQKDSFIVGDDQNFFEEVIFLDLEHCIIKTPLCIGVFGICVIKNGKIYATQTMIESEADSQKILKMMYRYFKRSQKKYIVTFAGENDFSVIRHLFGKYGYQMEVFDRFEHLDLQKIYERMTEERIGLKNLEKLFGLGREESDLISGSTLARTFFKAMEDETYFSRIPKEKIELILNYNLHDVINLFYIMSLWKTVVVNKVE